MTTLQEVISPKGLPIEPSEGVVALPQDFHDKRPHRLVDSIDRLSAVPFSGMVRDPNFIDLPKDKEETRPKRASPIGASLRRLFSKSPAKERSTSDTNGSMNGPGTTESAPVLLQRGRTLPKPSTSQISNDSGMSSTLHPNNKFYVPPKLRDNSDRNIMGDLMCTHSYSHLVRRA